MRWLLLLSGCAGASPYASSERGSWGTDPDPDGPRQPRLEARGTFEGERPRVPVAPEGCQARVHLVVPHEICERPGLGAHIDEALLDQWSTRHLGLSAKTPYRASPLDTSPRASKCSLICDEADKEAYWNLSLTASGQTGLVGCVVGEVARLEVEVVPVGEPVADGVGVMWLTDLSRYRVGFSMRPDGEGHESSHLIGDNLCPAGQPTREGGVAGALDAPQEQ